MSDKNILIQLTGFKKKSDELVFKEDISIRLQEYQKMLSLSESDDFNGEFKLNKSQLKEITKLTEAQIDTTLEFYVGVLKLVKKRPIFSPAIKIDPYMEMKWIEEDNKKTKLYITFTNKYFPLTVSSSKILEIIKDVDFIQDLNPIFKSNLEKEMLFIKNQSISIKCDLIIGDNENLIVIDYTNE